MKLKSPWAFVCLVPLLGCATSPAPTSQATAPREVEALQPAPPFDPTEELQRIGFGSCLHQEHPQPILQKVMEEDFELFLFLGDNVYGDVDRPDDLKELRQAYDLQKKSEPLRKLRSTTPILAVWDDHDYGLNDGGADFGGREASERLFEEFWQIPPEAPSARRPGVYDSVILGPPGKRVQILLLDTRFFRSPLRPTDEPGAPGKERYLPDEDPSKTMLGETQWKWLEEELARPAELRLLVSSIQVIAEGHGWESWRLLPAERQRLFDVLRSSGAEGVVILSGDRHRAAIYHHDEALAYPLFEITSSSLNLPFRDTEEEPGPLRLGPSYWQANYGAITIDWSSGVVDLEVRDLGGETALWHSLDLSRLAPVEVGTS